MRSSLALIGLACAPVNALGQALREQLLEACERAAADASVKAIVLHGEVLLFSAGADISEFGSPASFARPDLPSLLVRLTELDKPLIAAIGGLALGGGLELALACGYRVAEANARLGLPEIKLGLLPGAGGTQRLPRLIGAAAALEIIASGQPISAERALELGCSIAWSRQTPTACSTARAALAAALIAEQAPGAPGLAASKPGAAALPAELFRRLSRRQPAPLERPERAAARGGGDRSGLQPAAWPRAWPARANCSRRPKPPASPKPCAMCSSPSVKSASCRGWTPARRSARSTGSR